MIPEVRKITGGKIVKLSKGLLLVLAVLAGLLLAGLVFAGGQKEDKDETLTIVLVPKSVGHPFWADLEKGMDERADEIGV